MLEFGEFGLLNTVEQEGKMSSPFLFLPIVFNSDLFFRSVLPAQGASGLRVVLVVVESQQQFGQIRVYLVVPDAG